MDPTAVRHIEKRRNRDGQDRAFVVGTRVRVQDVYVLSELHGKTPDEIMAAFPHLGLAQVHAALAYYFDHMDEIQNEIREDDEFVERFRQTMGPGPLERKLRGMDGNADSVSS
jgi:uncharacterized protein (DUF433 family)